MNLARAACVVALGASIAGCWLTSSFDDLRATNGSDAGPNASKDAGHSDAAASDAGCLATTYVASVMADSPLDYYRFDDPPGSTTAHDSAGANNGTFTGTVTLSAAGVLPDDTAASFDGTSGHVVVANGPTFDGSKPFTLEAWIYPTKIDTVYRGVISNESPTTTSRSGYTLFVEQPSGDANQVGFERFAAGSSNPITVPTVSDNAWSHLAATFDGTALVLYANGVVIGQDSSQIVSIPQGYTFVIGALYSAMVSSFFAGSIDEVAIYDHPLTARCVQAHYHLGLSQAP